MISNTDELEQQQKAWEVDRAEESEEGDEGEDDDGDYEAGADEGEEEVGVPTGVGQGSRCAGAVARNSTPLWPSPACWLRYTFISCSPYPPWSSAPQPQRMHTAAATSWVLQGV